MRFGVYGFVQNNPMSLIDICGLVVKITYVTPDGNKAIVELEKGGTIDDFMALLRKIKQEKGKICEFHCGGHGSIDNITLNGVWEGTGLWTTTDVEGSLKLSSDGINISLREQYEKNGEPAWKHATITAELEELLGENALIDFNACLTASEYPWFRNGNLAKRVSRVFPNARVKGSRGFAAGGPIWGQESFLRIPRTYVNGKAQ